LSDGACRCEHDYLKKNLFESMLAFFFRSSCFVFFSPPAFIKATIELVCGTIFMKRNAKLSCLKKKKMQAQQPTMSVQAYFNTKKASRDDSVGVAGTNTMIFDDYGKAGSRGIKSWQKARFENYDQRLKKQLYYEEQRKLEQWKKKTRI